MINLGDGMTQIVPVCQGYPVECSIIKQFPITGKNINTFITKFNEVNTNIKILYVNPTIIYKNYFTKYCTSSSYNVVKIFNKILIIYLFII